MQNLPPQDEWSAWLEIHAARFLLFARQQTRTAADAEDLLQEALVETWVRCRGRAPDPALVFATLHRRAIDLARRRDARARREAGTEPDTPWFSPEVEDREQQQLLADAVKNLPANLAEVVTLKIWGGLTFKQIAGVLGIPLNTAASRYRYGLEELRNALKEVLS